LIADGTERLGLDWRLLHEIRERIAEIEDPCDVDPELEKR
jgi:hypothetical protein